jgi:hypothetical protein
MIAADDGNLWNCAARYSSREIAAHRQFSVGRQLLYETTER